MNLKYFYILLIIMTNFNFGMETDINDLPIELLTYIAEYLLSDDSERISEKLLNYRRFAFVIWSMNCARINLIGQNLTTEQYILFFSQKLRINPFFIARFLKITLPKDLNKKFTQKALENEIKKYNFQKEKIGSKFCAEGLFRSHLEQSFFNVSLKKEHQFVKLLLYLLSIGTNPNLISFYTERENTLTYSALCGCQELVDILLNVGAIPNYHNRLGKTALYNAVVYSKNKEIIKKLLSAGADINLSSSMGNTPLMSAAFNGYEEVVKILLKNGADAECKNIKGYTALILASKRERNKQVVKQLLEAGVKIDAQNDDGNTALITAVEHNCIEIVYLLLLNNAEPNIRNKEGYTALYCAKRNNNNKMMKLLKSYGAQSSKCVSS